MSGEVVKVVIMTVWFDEVHKKEVPCILSRSVLDYLTQLSLLEAEI